MATKKQPTRRSTPGKSSKPQVEPVLQDQPPKPNGESGESIAELAHRLFVERGGEHGRDLEDWLEAERRIRNGH
jgi:Protein of unknown function (DUF2934)